MSAATLERSTGIKCGNRRVHGMDRVYHVNSQAVRACFQGYVALAPAAPAPVVEQPTISAPEVTPRPEPRAKIDFNSIKTYGKHGSQKTGYGFYALPNRENDGGFEFYRVERPGVGRFANFTFVKRQASDDFHPVPKSVQFAVLAKIAEDVDGSAEVYGQQIGACCICRRTLTDDTSRARGIGPECFKKHR